ncbi:MAG: hypothetical protein R3327_03710 [Nitrosopumilaceae archaeon]|nr:hypothetical protein [Nitrosopumilaceae archaeon]
MIYRDGKKQGKLLEFSKKNLQYFCVAEFENKIKLFGEVVEGTPRQNASVELKECDMVDESYLFKMIMMD